MLAARVATSLLFATACILQAQPLSVATFAGAGGRGSAIGAAASAQFSDPSGVAVDSATNIFVADSYNNVIRLIVADATGTNWTVKSMAGLPGAAGRSNGTNTSARFNNPTGIAVDGATNVYVADTGNHSIRRLQPDATHTNWIVTTIAGATAGTPGFADGTNNTARFNGPTGIALDSAGNLWVADTVNHTIRKLTPDATGTNWAVTTFAGAAGAPGSADGAGNLARFSNPNSVALDAANNLYVADGGNNAIRMITPAGMVTNIAGGQAGAADGVGTNAQFSFPCGLAVDAATNLYVSDFYNQTVRRLTRTNGGWSTVTVAGRPLLPGNTDGVATLARFQFSNARNNPNGLGLDRGGRIFIADTENCEIRRATVFQGLIFTALPQNVAAVAGGTTTLNATAVGALPVTYQWLRNGAMIDGATNATLTLANLLTNDSGSYSVIASNSAGFSNSPAAVVTVVLPLAVTTMAGIGAVGSADGFGLAARFDSPRGVAVDAAGNVVVADAFNNTIRQVSPVGDVTTLAGTAQVAGTNDGAASAARFSFPFGVAVDGAGTTYVADTLNRVVRAISAGGVVNTIAGMPGASGFRDGPAAQALFGNAYGIAADRAGVVYVADTVNNRIREIAHGYVTTVAGDGNAGAANGAGATAEFAEPLALAVDAVGNIFVADYGNGTIRKITPGGAVTTIAGTAGVTGYADGNNGLVRFNLPSGIAVDAQENVYVADFGNQVIRKLRTDPGGNWASSTPAGFPQVGGDSDGAALGARFNGPTGVAVDSLGYLYVSDASNNVIRKVTPNGAVSTLAGPAHSFGTDDGPFPGNRFNTPTGVTADADGNLYVADSVNNTIREVGPDGSTITIAGLPGFGGSSDGVGSNARFSQPTGLTADSVGNLYVADFQNSTIRKMTYDSDANEWTVTTLAGSARNPGYANGPGTNALFNGPIAVAVDGAGNIFVSDYSNQVVRVITSSGQVSNYAGSPGHAGFGDGANAFFNYPVGLAVDSFNNVVVADSQNQLIRRIAPGGSVSTLAGAYFTPGSADGNGGAARFNLPQGVTVDASGNIFVADTGNNTIREIIPGGGVVTVAAAAGWMGSFDGVGAGAQFNRPLGLVAAPSGDLFVADAANNTIRRATAFYGQSIVLTPALSRAAPAGAPVTFAPVVAGAAPLSYQWLLEGDPVTDATNLALTFPDAEFSDEGDYQLSVSNSFGTVTSPTATLTVGLTPQIFANPGALVALSNSSPTLAVTAYGAPPLSYQWSFNTVALADATNAALTLTNIQPSQQGTYQVVVSNPFGSATSLWSEVTLAAPPQILAGPSSQAGQCGGTLVLTAQGSGTPPLSYQWLLGGNAIAGATLPAFTASNLLDGQTQFFAVIVSNAYGAATSAVAAIAVSDTAGPVITVLGAAVTNILVGTPYLDPGATANDLCAGPEPVATNGAVNTNVPGAYVISYRASDGNGNAATNTRLVNVAPAAAVIVTQPASHTNYPGATQTLTVAVTGTTPMTFQWFKNAAKLSNGGHVAGATNQTLTLSLLSAADAGSYFVTVSNVAGGAVSSNAIISVGPAAAPVALTGFNADVVVERTATGGNTANYAQIFDTESPPFCFYEAGLGASNIYGTSPTNLGLVSSRTYVSAVDGATIFQFAPYTANNTLYLNAAAPSGALHFASPANFNFISILAASANGGGAGTWTMQFADGTSSPAFNFNAADWQGTSGGAVTHFGELYYGNYGIFYAYNLVNNFPSLYQTSVNLADLGWSGKAIASITFTKPAGGTLVTGVFAVSGTPGPALAPLAFGSPALNAMALSFTLQSELNQTYRLQQTTNLAPGSWQTCSNILGDGSLLQFNLPLTNQQQFFRLVTP
jgi:hypothetical protein